MEEMWSVYDSMVVESGYKYDCLKFKEVLKESKEYLLKLNTEKRLEIIRELLKNPNFDGTDVYYLTMIEIQEDTSYKPPLVGPQKPRSCKIRFVMSGRRPTEPIREEGKAARKTDETGRKRSRGSSSDCEFDEEDEKVRVNKKKKKVNNLVITENIPDLPSDLKERIKNLGGTEASLVIQKGLYATDVSSGHGRLSLPWLQIKDKEFLSEKEKDFLDRKRDVVPEMEARLIGENGKEHEMAIRVWNGVPNLVKGWNGVVIDHGLGLGRIVQLWSFRVEGKLWFALVKLGISKKSKEKLRIS
ncbi:hypothetical protein Vadar_007547 [Vaccinium darrowii]|uniref:Uncharacterized protein n=1 Tax=Vaccinium darrowii TaxID=229202 RepID=A0ACB7XH51_9ERIC|nr:hypothetical protein Vadar_007547 [Vaccinium darrowii]